MDAPASAGAFLFALRSLRHEAAAPVPRRRAETPENLAKILGQGGLRPHGLPGPGMGEAQAARVKHLARRLDARRRKVPSPVDRIAQDGVARRCEVHANLMRPSRLELDRDEGCGAEPLENPVMRDGATSFLARLCDPASPVAGVSNEIGVEEAVFRESASDERDVLALDVMSAKESLQIMEGLAVASEDESAGRVAVQPVNHERDGAPRIPVMQVVEHEGKKGVAFMLSRRNREESGGLVDDQKIRILDEHGQARANPAALRTARVK